METPDEARARLRENYAYKKRIGRCTRCGGMDARTMIGGALCFDCIEYEKEIHDRKRDERNEKQRERGKSLYQRRKESGICVACGKKTDNGMARCSRCLAKHRRADKKNRVKNGCNELPRVQTGLCYICQKEKPVDGYKVCESCLERCRKIPKVPNKEDHPWNKSFLALECKHLVRYSPPRRK